MCRFDITASPTFHIIPIFVFLLLQQVLQTFECESMSVCALAVTGYAHVGKVSRISWNSRGCRSLACAGHWENLTHCLPNSAMRHMVQPLARAQPDAAMRKMMRRVLLGIFLPILSTKADVGCSATVLRYVIKALTCVSHAINTQWSRNAGWKRATGGKLSSNPPAPGGYGRGYMHC